METFNSEIPDSVLETLKGIFNELFAPHKVVDVLATDDVGWEGDPLVKISIVFEDLPGEDGLPDMKKTVGMRTKVYPVLEEAGVARWPYFSVITKHELRHATA